METGIQVCNRHGQGLIRYLCLLPKNVLTTVYHGILSVDAILDCSLVFFIVQRSQDNTMTELSENVNWDLTKSTHCLLTDQRKGR